VYTANGDGNVGYRVYNIRPSVQDTSRLQYKPVRITHPVYKTRLGYNTDRYILLIQCIRHVSATIQIALYYLPSVQDLSQLQYRPARTIHITVCKTQISVNTDRYVLLTQCTRHVSATIQTGTYYLCSVQDTSQLQYRPVRITYVQDTSRLQYRPVRITYVVYKTRLGYNADRYVLLM